ncbi:MAG TPA: tryptophan synthase subunit alpha [Nitrospiria bacterium]|nr:tryptophan synthase subunit alpha [Nitrospiria bacterium]
MNRIEKTFERLRAEKEKALVVYIMAGDPNLETSERLVLELESAGADLIELGVPFSDPIADGPVIQRADERALKQKISLRDILAMVARLRERTDVPLILMTYENPVCKFGERRFVEESVKAGVDGVIVPDLPMEEAGPLHNQCRKHGLALILLAAPTSPPTRLKKIAAMSHGFVYYVSMTGITGSNLGDLTDVRSHVAMIKQYTQKPVVVGFGISTPEQARRIGGIADGIVVGSAVVKVIEEQAGSPSGSARVMELVQALKEAVG